MNSALTLVFKPSRRLTLALGFCHGLAAAAVLASPLPWDLRGLLLAAVLAGWAADGHRLGRSPAVRQARVSEAGEWRLWTAQGQEIAVRLLPGTVVTPWLILLHYRDEGGAFRAVPILPDSLEADGFRWLTVRLRSGRI